VSDAITIKEFRPKGFVKDERYPSGRPVKKDEQPTYSNFEHWAGIKETSDYHGEYATYLSTPMDQITVYCSCGEWAASASFYSSTPKEVSKILAEAHDQHRLNGYGLVRP